MSLTAATAAIALASLTTATDAQTTSSMFCDTPRAIVTFLASDYGETALLEMGAEGAKPLYLFANQDTGTWTLVAIESQISACIIGSGDSFKPVEG